MVTIRFGVVIFAAVIALVACSASRTNNTVAAPPETGVHVTADETTAGFRPAAEAITRKRLEWLGVTFDPESGRSARLKLNLRLQYRNLTLPESATIWQMTTVLLATLYPSACQHRSYSLVAQITDAEGHSRFYEESDSTVAWMWLFQGPRCGDNPSQEEVASATRSMLNDIYDRMIEDNAFAPDTRMAEAALSPLVLIKANRAEEISEQVLRVDRPFERWTMVEDSTVTPAYRVDLFFDVRPRGFSIHRAYMSIMTFGLAGMCKATPISLIATVTNPSAPRSRSFMATESVRGRIADNECEPQDESTRPEIFAKLLRKALAAIRSENLTVPLAAAETSNAPWVRVSSNIAEGIVRAEIIRSGQIQRFLYSDAAEYAPAYSLTIEFEFQGGGRRDLKGASAVGAGLAIAWLGRNAMCHTNVLVLDAMLRDPQNAQVRHYRESREFEFSGDMDPTDCRDNEASNPEIVRDLVRWLFDEMKADGTLALLAES